jgi:hypothetical protein
MNAAGSESGPDHERAETYLRLQAEAELRTALGFPRYKPPGRRRLTARLHDARRMRRRRAAVRRMHGDEPARLWPRLAPPAALLQRSASRVWQQASPAWHRVIFGARRVRRRALRRLHPPPVRSELRSPPAEACLSRIALLAAAFVRAGAVDERAAEWVLADLRTSLAARGLIEQGDLLTGPSSRTGRPNPAVRSASGQLRAVPVGATTDCELAGRPGRLRLGTVTIGPDQADLTVRGRLLPSADAEPTTGRSLGHRPHPLIAALEQCTAVDDRGASYHVSFSGGADSDSFDGRLQFMPVPPGGVRWLDLALAGVGPIRVDLSAAAAQCQVTSTSFAPAGTAERYIDSLSRSLLLDGWFAGLVDGAASEQAAAVASLMHAGVLPETSPALSHFAAVASRLGAELPAPLADIRPVPLPGEWLAILDRTTSDDGPVGAIPLAVVLPELDGARCVLAELTSEGQWATLRVSATGWPPHEHLRSLPVEPFTFAARDDVGGLYLVSQQGGSYSSSGHAEMELQLRPAISPAARSLEITLTGKTGEVSATVPLNWQEDL